jgi:RNA-binding protein PNO1
VTGAVNSVQDTQATQIPDTETHIDEEGRPQFPPAKDVKQKHRSEKRKVLVPPHRMTPLKTSWSKIYPPLVEHLKLQVRMNIRARVVEMKTSTYTVDSGALQKGEDFVKAFSLGFDVDDSIALLRLDDLFIEVYWKLSGIWLPMLISMQTFEIKDVKTLHGEHLGRAIGRIAGKDGRLSVLKATMLHLSDPS